MTPPTPPSSPPSHAGLSAVQCRDDEVVRAFVSSRISPNGWPIRCAVLRRRLTDGGLDLEADAAFEWSMAGVESMLREFHDRSRRVERRLSIDNAYHRTLHAYEVLLRLLPLEWPSVDQVPEAVRRAPDRIYRSLDEVMPDVVAGIRAARAAGITWAVLARDLLATLGHDYGHTGGTDRVDGGGVPAPQAHEDVAERHIALFGLRHRIPPSIIVEALAGIRATSFFIRPGRERIVMHSDFERKLALADVMGCVLPTAEWLTHVAVPVLLEKIPAWRRRAGEIAIEIGRLCQEIAHLPPGSEAHRAKQEAIAELNREDNRIIKDIPEWLRSERGFLLFIEAHRMAQVPGAVELWGDRIKRKVAALEATLERVDLLQPLQDQGFALLERYAARVANRASLEEALHDGWPAEMTEVLRMLAAAG